MFASKDVFLKSSGGGYTISRSVRLRNSASAYLSRTPASASNQKTWTWSAWVKRGVLDTKGLFAAGTSNANVASFQFGYNTTDSLTFYWYQTGPGFLANIETTARFRDPSAWYHVVLSVDTTQATAANRIKIYVNNVQMTALYSASYPAQNSDMAMNSTLAHAIGGTYGSGSGAQNYDGQITELNFVDGQALTPSSFGATNATTGVWQPIAYTGTYGTNGFYLKFDSYATAAALGTDSSGNSNTWTVNNISVTTGATYDSMLDVPTLTSATVANYCVMNPLSNIGTGNLYTFSNGNLSTTVNVASGNRGIVSTYGMTSGAGIKYYVEINVTAFGASNNSDYGILNTSTTVMTTGSFAEAGCIGAYLSNGYSISQTGKVMNNGATLASGLTTFADGDTVQIAYDGTNIYFGRNGTWLNSAVPASGTGGFSVAAGTYGIAMGASANTTKTCTANFKFGQQPFTYSAPTGFVALNTYNLSTPTIPNGATQFAATTYTGTSASNAIVNTVNGTNFQPDFVWIKNRNYGAGTNHVLVDSVRGTSVGLASNLTNADFSTSGNFSTINSNGFTVTGTARDYNFLADTFVGWQWKANGTGVSNTSGSITSTVSANTTAGFSVVTYTGTGANATVGHGLGVAPSMVIAKNRTTADDWMVWHIAFPGTDYILLDTTGAKGTLAGVWNSTVPSSTVFSLGTNLTVNRSGNANVAYVFAAVAGYSAFGSYTGNGSTDGPFVYLGFRPRWVMVKRTDSTSDWYIWDTTRDTYNVVTATLLADTSGAETSATSIDNLSNGFKCRSATVVNASGGTYIYMAFAENPFKYSLAR